MSIKETNAVNVTKFYDEAARCPTSSSLHYREQTRIVHLRNFNNWIKSILFNDYLQHARNQFGHDTRFRILDFCCGKGGDQLKWAQAGVDHVTFVDISSASVDACKQRYNQLRNRRRKLYTADFHVSDCTADISRSILCDRQYELVSCQFCLHYAFESFFQAHNFLNNVSCCLRPGGFFIATIPNAYELVRRANQAYNSSPRLNEDKGRAALEFGNSIYSVRFPRESFTVNHIEPPLTDDGCPKESCDSLQFPLFGARYEFHLESVVDCPEFLVYPPLVDQLAAEYELKPAAAPIPFAQYFQTTLCNRSGREDPCELLTRMNALETWIKPEKRGLEDRLVAQHEPNAYSHVENQIAKDPDTFYNSTAVGTISQAEWDVINLYSVIAFQKQ
ncbi:mRNA cap guanine-N7 methyltransferase [Paragonimus heterotremus]|uniref:mRNA cap guanine-N(7) methyltransferase n=1 Tax=Paragonimus heterotremus TaxID=100268 RepID=A0A8J4WI27_9TREM|nr:mRNA cap guanine-N7 methyltransferase [Paragonimus heterotremus]